MLEASRVASATALVVGAGGLGCPALLALVRSGVGRILVADDDFVEESNLHRQLLYREQDVGQDKLSALGLALTREGYPAERFQLIRTRLLPHNAIELVRRADIVLEGSDNFATKFLAADAAHLAGRPIVHGAAVRWVATAWCVAAAGRPCYRCLFEAPPPAESAPNCAEAGVMGPVVGMAGALMADLSLRFLAGDETACALYTIDGKRDEVRRVSVSGRPDCPLCGPQATISDTAPSRYVTNECSI